MVRQGTGKDGSISIVVLMCHAPIVIPAIGGIRAAACTTTTRAMTKIAERIVVALPDLLVVVSPHTPRHANAWGLVANDRLVASMARFKAPDVIVDLPGAPDGRRLLLECCRRNHVALKEFDLPTLDHGAAVPLWFLQSCAWRGPTMVVGMPQCPDDHRPFGKALLEAARESGQRWALIASGDMSHRLTRDAPAGYHPNAAKFDRFIVDGLNSGRPLRIDDVDEGLREIAGEDVVDSLLVAEGAIATEARCREVLAYEGPFGVGYCEAVLHAASESQR